MTLTHREVPGPPAPAGRTRGWWIAPLVSTLLTVPVWAAMGAALLWSPMAFDGCTPGGCGGLEFHVLAALVLFLVCAVALPVHWATSRNLRNATLRRLLLPVPFLLALATVAMLVTMPQSQ